MLRKIHPAGRNVSVNITICIAFFNQKERNSYMYISSKDFDIQLSKNSFGILSDMIHLLYISGSVGGSWYRHSGAAVNYLCLPKQPEWLSRKPGSGAYLYGGEYNNADFGLQDGDDIPCAMCRATDNSVMMIPAHVSCNSGWTRLYGGYLGAGHHGSTTGTGIYMY